MDDLQIKKLKYFYKNINEIKSEIFDIKKNQEEIKFKFKENLKQYKIKNLLHSINSNKNV